MKSNATPSSLSHSSFVAASILGKERAEKALYDMPSDAKWLATHYTLGGEDLVACKKLASSLIGLRPGLGSDSSGQTAIDANAFGDWTSKYTDIQAAFCEAYRACCAAAA